MEKKNLKTLSKTELLDLAKKNKISSASKLTKDELINTLQASSSAKTAQKNTSKKTAKKSVSGVKTASAATLEPQGSISIESDVETIGRSKFYIGRRDSKFVYEDHFVFPPHYGATRVVLLVRDPYWMHAYWEITEETIEAIKASIGHDAFYRSKMVIRVKDVTDCPADKAKSWFDIEVTYGANNWYINISADNRSYCVEIGYKTPDDSFVSVAQSNNVHVPRSGVSNVLDESWSSIEEYDRMYALSGGLHAIGKSSAELKEMMEKRLQEWISSGIPSSVAGSGGLFEAGAAKKAAGKKERSFFLVVDTELIVYGVTVPDASLTIQGRPKKLNPDGTFSARFSLPDGLQVIPVKAVSSDKIDEITITPIVKKETK